MNLSMKPKQNCGHKEQSCGCQRRGTGGRMEWEVGVSSSELLYIEWINTTVLLYNTENCIQYPLINHNKKNSNRIYITESLYSTTAVNTL